MTETFTVTDDQLMAQLVQGCGYDKDQHLLWSDLEVKIITEDGARTARQVQWYLHTQHWVEDPIYATCGVDECVDVNHLTVSKTEAEEFAAKRLADKEAADLLLVERSTPSLASLYKKGKARGLISPRSEYGG